MKFVDIKRILLYFIPLVTLAYVLINQYFRSTRNAELQTIKNLSTSILDKNSLLIQNIYNNLESNINIIEWIFNENYNHSTKHSDMAAFLLHFANLQQTFDQVRFLDTLGQEITRVDFDTINTARIIPHEKLQNKSHRYYFKAIKMLEMNEIYFSNIDLNLDYGEIELPYTPVLRVAKKTFNATGQWNGVVIINSFLDRLFETFNSPDENAFLSFELLDEQGNFLLSDDGHKNFSHLLTPSEHLSLPTANAQLWNNIQQSNTGKFQQNNIIYQFIKLSLGESQQNKRHFANNGELILIEKIDLSKVDKLQWVESAYKWAALFGVSLVILFGLVAIQYYNFRLRVQNRKLDLSNRELQQVKNKLEESLKIKQSELQVTERKFHSLFNNAAVGITLVDTNGKPVYSNKRLSSILGYSEEELSHLSFAEFTHPEDVDANLMQFKKLLRREINSYNMQKRYVRKDGTTIWADLNVSLLLDPENKIINVIGAVTDITDKKRNEHELFNHSQIINQVKEAIVATDENGTINYWNKGAEKLFGYSREEITGKTIPVLYPPGEGKKMVRYIVDALKTSESVNLETTMIKKDNTRFDSSITVSQRYNSDGSFAGRIGSVRNISSRKLNERKLLSLNRELNENIRFLNNSMEHSPFAMWISDSRGTIIRTNRALRKILKINDDQILGTYNVFDDQNLTDQNLMPLVEKVFNEYSTQRFELQWQEDSSGFDTFTKPRKYWLDLTMIPIISEEGTLQNVVCQWINITEQKKAGQKIQQMAQNFLTVFNEMNDSVALVDFENKFVDANQTLLNRHGFSLDEIKGQSIKLINPYIDQAEREQLTRELKHSGKRITYESKHVRKNGEVFPVKVHLKTISYGGTDVILKISRDISERLANEKAIKESANMLQSITVSAQDAIILIDNKGDVVFWNPAAHRILGYTAEEMRGKNFHQMIPPHKYRADHVKHFSHFRKTGKGRLIGKNIELEAIHKDGHVISIELSLAATKIDEKWGATGLIRDITERKQTEAQLKKYQNQLEDLVKQRTDALEASNIQLKEQQYRLNAAFTSSGYSWWDMRVQDNKLHTHSGKLEAMGYSAEQVDESISWWKKQVHSKDLKVIWNIKNKITRGTSSFNCEIRLRNKNGIYHWFNERGSVIERDKNGNPIRIIGTSEDITEKKKTNFELLKLSKAVQQSPFVVVITNQAAQIEYVNPAFERLTGYQLDEVLGKNPKILNARKSPKSTYIDLWNTILSGKTWTGELCNKSKTGNIFWENAVITPVFDDEGSIVNFIAIKENITERKQFIEDLEKAKQDAEAGNRAKSEFLANMSHEIRTPMNAVIGFTDLLYRKIDNPQHLKHLESIKTSSKNLLTIINDILDVSKIEAGKIEIQKAPVNVLTILEELETIFSQEADNKGLAFSTNAQYTGTILVASDEIRIKQVLFNLISNAIKFTSRGFVSVTLKKDQIEKNRLCFVVSDSGIGIPKALQQTVFDTFVQQEGQDYKTYGGTGLGLTISKKLANLLGGDILLESEKDKGSTFTFELNDVEYIDDSQHHYQRTNFNHEFKFAERHILVIDDIASNLDYMQTALRELGLQVYLAENGQQGLEMLNKHKIDLIISDIKMPKLDGYGFVNALRKGKFAHIPCIASTASALKKEITTMQQVGFDAIVLKPIQFQELIEVLKPYIPHQINQQNEVSKPTELLTLAATDRERITPELESVLIPLHKKLKEHQATDDLDRFAEAMYSIGDTYNIKTFCTFSNQLKNAIDNFDIEEIIALINAFGKIVTSHE